MDHENASVYTSEKTNKSEGRVDDNVEHKAHQQGKSSKIIAEPLNEEGLEEDEENEEGLAGIEKIESAAFDFLILSEERWEEINFLIDQIEANKDNEHIYNILCRSAVVLIVAHLEGYIKEAAAALVDDLKVLQFEDLPKFIKKTYVSSFLQFNDHSKSDGKKIEKLISEFEKLNAKIEVDPFLYENNKNPSPNVIDKIMKNFGVHNFFAKLHNSKLDIVFENDLNETTTLINKLREDTFESVKYFPYNIRLDLYDICDQSGSFKKNDSMWNTFLDDLLKKRHSVAHGSVFENELTSTMLIDFKYKVQILQYAIALVLFDVGIKSKSAERILIQ